MSDYYADLMERVDNFHAFTLGDRAALIPGRQANPYTGHSSERAYHWQLGYCGYPFPEREKTNA